MVNAGFWIAGSVNKATYFGTMNWPCYTIEYQFWLVTFKVSSVKLVLDRVTICFVWFFRCRHNSHEDDQSLGEKGALFSEKEGKT